jgi:hypothetical protein
MWVVYLHRVLTTYTFMITVYFANQHTADFATLVAFVFFTLLANALYEYTRRCDPGTYSDRKRRERSLHCKVCLSDRTPRTTD